LLGAPAYFFILFFSISQFATAQLGLCNGEPGPAIFTEDFGTGTNIGPELEPGITSYTFRNTGIPPNGSYTITHSISTNNWHKTYDHTLNDTDGKMLVVNADEEAGAFYETTITGLCTNTTYEFSSWSTNLLKVDNVCGNRAIDINVRFEILDATRTTILKAGDTGDIGPSTRSEWNQYGMLFKTLPGQTSVVLRMSNNGAGGCGNDLAIDDIAFRRCSDSIEVVDPNGASSSSVCEDAFNANGITLYANATHTVFTSYAYQWEQSSDSVNWTTLSGANNQTYTPQNVELEDNYFRVIVAEDAVNLKNSSCNVISSIYHLTLNSNPNPPQSNGYTTVCEDSIIYTIAPVTVEELEMVNWYDAPSGGTLLQENSTTFSTTNSGIFYAEAINSNTGCVSTTRTAIDNIAAEIMELPDVLISICPNESVSLSPVLNGNNYLWDNGLISREIIVDEAGIYGVNIFNNNDCPRFQIFIVEEQEFIPINFQNISAENRDIVVEIDNTEEFLYSIDSVNFQESSIFQNLSGGVYTIYVQSKNGCSSASQEYLHLFIPNFFTPNGDGINEQFIAKGIENLEQYSMDIYDCYGKLLANFTDRNVGWNGTLNNRSLPSSDYWYKIQADGQIFNGHFTLKR